MPSANGRNALAVFARSHDFATPPAPESGEPHSARFGRKEAVDVERVMAALNGKVERFPQYWSEYIRAAVHYYTRSILETGLLDGTLDPATYASLKSRILERDVAAHFREREDALLHWQEVVFALERRLTKLNTARHAQEGIREIERVSYAITELRSHDPTLGDDVWDLFVGSRDVQEYVRAWTPRHHPAAHPNGGSPHAPTPAQQSRLLGDDVPGLASTPS